MAPALGCRPIQIKLAIDDIDVAVSFYQRAFGFHYDVTRRTDEADYSGFVFGRYGGTDFFLLHLVDDATDADRPGPATFGLLVDDLNQSHAHALAAGARETTPPHDAQGMPRCSVVRDPSGNWIWPYQG